MDHILSSRLLSTRGGTILLGGLAALLAAVLLLVYLNGYRSSVVSAGKPVTVLVAKRLIQKGTPGNLIGSEELFAPTKVRESQLREGAIADPAAFRGRIAVSDIYPGQQLTVADFTTAMTGALNTQLARTQRAISIPIDSAHGMIGQIQAGDHVDVFAGFNVERNGGASKPILKLLMPNALVLATPGAGGGGLSGGGGSKNVVLRASYQQAAEIAFTADNGTLWLLLRPTGNARPTRPSLVTVETVLFGIKPVQAQARLTKFVGARP